MPRFTDPRKLERYLKKALDAQVAETLITVQEELGSPKVSPVDTGRFLSNWFAAEGVASTQTTEATNSPQTDARGLRVDSRKEYHLTNSLPYAQKIAIEGKTNPGKNQKSKPSTWFVDFRSSRIPKIGDEAGRQIKQEFDL